MLTKLELVIDAYASTHEHVKCNRGFQILNTIFM